MDGGIHRKIALAMAVLAVAVLLALVWRVGSAATLGAKNLSVCSSGCPCMTIQETVYVTEDGDKIRVAVGTCTGQTGSDRAEQRLCSSQTLMLGGIP